jgi:hypothetical protein
VSSDSHATLEAHGRVQAWLFLTLRVDSLRTVRVRSQLADEEFLKEIADSRAADSDKCVFKSQPSSIAAAGWIVQVRYAASREAAQDT